MNDYGTQISTRDDFKDVKIYERQEQGKPVYTIAFNNPELKDHWFRSILAVSILIASPGLPLFILENITGSLLVALATPVIIVFISYFVLIKNPKWVERGIVLDAGNDELNVLKNGAVEKKNKYSRLHEIMIDEHSKGAKQRIKREENGGRQIGGYEKVHCLFGLFGVSGTEKVILVSRYEWPRHDTLYEVQQAMQWANNRRADLEDHDTGKPSISLEEKPSQSSATGIKPPLD